MSVGIARRQLESGGYGRSASWHRSHEGLQYQDRAWFHVVALALAVTVACFLAVVGRLAVAGRLAVGTTRSCWATRSWRTYYGGFFGGGKFCLVALTVLDLAKPFGHLLWTVVLTFRTNGPRCNGTPGLDAVDPTRQRQAVCQLSGDK